MSHTSTLTSYSSKDESIVSSIFAIVDCKSRINPSDDSESVATHGCVCDRRFNIKANMLRHVKKIHEDGNATKSIHQGLYPPNIPIEGVSTSGTRRLTGIGWMDLSRCLTNTYQTNTTSIRFSVYLIHSFHLIRVEGFLFQLMLVEEGYMPVDLNLALAIGIRERIRERMEERINLLFPFQPDYIY